MNKQKGFTLVELLVVIAIIAILAGAVLLAINPAATMQKSRDATRLSDMDSLRNAITIALTEGEIELVTAGPFTSVLGGRGQSVIPDDTGAGPGWVTFLVPTGKVGLSRYLATLPVDPSNNADTGLVYTFQSVGAADGVEPGFELNCQLEFADNGTKMENDGGSSLTAYEVGTSLTIIE